MLREDLGKAIISAWAQWEIYLIALWLAVSIATKQANLSHICNACKQDDDKEQDKNEISKSTATSTPSLSLLLMKK
uniref:Uncharacterized protein n=1 Tax=Glossina austeni TaxID=7395 RepID=A0A1A9VTT1_GLOAU